MEKLNSTRRSLRREIPNILKATERLFLLDLDGTLIDFTPPFGSIYLPDDLKKLLSDLARLDGMRLVVISGRSRKNIDGLLGDPEMDLVSEHGSFIREKGVWKTLNGSGADWKREVLRVMINFSKRIPEILIETKETTLTMHLRLLPVPEAARISDELSDELTNICNARGLRILKGKMTLEVMSDFVSKGKAVEHLIEDNRYDYILALGDDSTDEDMFNVLSERGYTGTVKIGEGQTSARYHLKDYLAVRRFLKILFVRLSVNSDKFLK